MIPELITDPHCGDRWVVWDWSDPNRHQVSLGRCFSDSGGSQPDLIVEEDGPNMVRNARAVSRGSAVGFLKDQWDSVSAVVSVSSIPKPQIQTVSGMQISRDGKSYCILTRDTEIMYLTVGDPLTGAVLRVMRDPNDSQKISVAALQSLGSIPAYSALWDDPDLCFLKLANRLGVPQSQVRGQVIPGREIAFTPLSIVKIYGIFAVDSTGIPAEVVVGRRTNKPSDVMVNVQQPEVSRGHCILKWTQTGVTITDLGSRMGTFVDSVPILEKTYLVSGALIQIGLTNFTFLNGPGYAYLVQTLTDFIVRPDT